MPPITALLHTYNDALRLGRALETLYPCDEILIVDHASSDSTVQVAREYGAHVLPAGNDTAHKQYLRAAAYDWIFCLDPSESTTESLAASLFEWKCLAPQDVIGAMAFTVFLREESHDGWHEISAPQTRLIPRTWNRWQGNFPADEPDALKLEGFLLRFNHP